MTSNLPSTRDSGWDSVKAILIYLVILGHCLQYLLIGNYWENPLYKAIYLFHMPLFILLSGYFSSSCMRPQAWRNIPSQLRRLGLPILTVILAQIALLSYRLWQQDLAPTTAQLLSCARGLWFLWVLLECWIAALLCFHFSSRLWRLLSTILIMLLGGYLPYGSYFISLWPFFLLGLYLKQGGFQFKHIRLSWLWTLPLAGLGWYFFRSEWSLYYAPKLWNMLALEYFILRSSIALVASASFLILVKLILTARLNTMLRGIGSCTMGIYVLQTYLFFSGMGRGILSKWGLTQGEALLPLIFTAPLILLACYGIYLISRKIRLIRLFLYGEK